MGLEPGKDKKRLNTSESRSTIIRGLGGERKTGKRGPRQILGKGERLESRENPHNNEDGY